jgi:hypothetical protein
MPRKTFVSGEILTASDVNVQLMDQSVMVFDDDAARTIAIPTPSEGMVTYLSDTNRVEVYTGAAFVPVPVGAGSILQVVSVNKTDVFTTTSTSFTPITDLEATITPSSTSSKILVSVSVSVASSSNTLATVLRLMRDSTAIGIGDAVGTRQRATLRGGAAFGATSASVVLDSPNTTSAVTYSVETGAHVSGGTTYINRALDDVNNTSFSNGRTISSITLMEVAG